MQRCPPNRSKGDAAAVKLGLGPEERPLKLGPSFTNPRGTAFHTLKYDFKPASVDVSKMASVAVEMNQQVTVTVPHLDGAGTEHTVFKGSQRPYQKECVLIIDRRTGEVVLEKLSSNIQVKKTRKETNKATAGAPGRPYQPGLPSLLDSSPPEQLAPSKKPLTGGTSKANSSGANSRNSTSSNNHRLKPQQMASSLSGCVPRHSPLRASPSYSSPGHHRSPTGPSGPSTQATHNRWSPPDQSTSLPMLGLDEGPTPMDTSVPKESPTYDQESVRPVGSLSDSSSDSSSGSGSSDSETDEPQQTNQLSLPLNGKFYAQSHGNTHAPSPALSVPDHLLNDDLQLSESSGSDSD
ncbi:Ell-associated factor Eaf [Frankliniella fusca]|uniref:Ell-associated factor Eaf n=1 Tax=Frankliniella fusca TaxID=407009 RepID=A0AAE1I367_9NEOP|nr:Ell-associated factor Eaf [Frankliniella fusca]